MPACDDHFRVACNGTVADIATRAFANLLTAAGKKKNVCVVVSDLAASYDTGTRLINRALEDARAELVKTVHATADTLQANLEQMKVVEDMRRTTREIQNVVRK